MTARKATMTVPPQAAAIPCRALLWKDGTRRGIAYVEEREVAEQVLAAAGRAVPAPVGDGKRRGAVSAPEAVPEGAMAVYLDRRGRPFAWQIPFDIGRWERIAALVGTE